jgi:hypothetical protein
MPFPFDPSPSTLWTLSVDAKLASCEVRFVPIGVEAKALTNGNLLYARTFSNGDDALAWAAGERKELPEKGWRTSGTDPHTSA